MESKKTDNDKANWGKAFGEAFIKASENMTSPSNYDHDYIVYVDNSSPFGSNQYTIQAVNFEHAYTIASMKSGREYIVQIVHANEPKENCGDY